MKSERIKVTLYNKTFKEIDLSDFSFIGEELFSYRDDIVEVVFPEGVEEIGASAFENCRRLEKVVFPNTLKKIGPDAFSNCTSLTTIEGGESAEVDPSAYKGCINL